MEIFYVENKPSLHVDWEVTRGKTSVREDFEHSDVWAFLTGDGGMLPLSVDVVENTLQIDIPMEGLDVGSYGLKVVWVKDGSGSQTLDQLLACNKRCMSEVFDLFGISASSYAETNPNSNITFHVKSSAATYGYDGLSAYERAIMLGKTTLSESEWLGELETAIYNFTQLAVVRGAGNFSAVQRDTASTANGSAAFCEGALNRADGHNSHCGGYICHAKASCSHVGGQMCVSETQATSSFCHGSHLITNNPNEAAFGRYNESHTGGDRANSTLFSVGKGDSDFTRMNAFEIMQDGTIKIWLNGNSVSLQDYLISIAAPQESTPAAGDGEEEPFPEENVAPNPYYYGSIGSWVGFPV